MIRILIVEDDENIAKTIEASLSIVGYESDLCDNGNDAVRMACDNPYDLILLDVMLPGMDGFEVIREIRHREIPVIFITARQDVTDRVKGLRLGAEDYLVKPFEVIELLARVDVVLRRAKKGETKLVFRDIVLDLDRHEAEQAGENVVLTPREFDLLAFFMKNVDIAISRERLLAAVWGYAFEGETRTVDVHVQQLRKKLKLKNFLVTVPKIGYRLENR